MTTAEQAGSSAYGCPGFVTGLVLRCARGDAGAMSALMDLLYAPVLARVSSDADGPESDELVARAFIRIWDQAPSYDPRRDGGSVAWLLDQAGAAAGSQQPQLVAS